MKTSTLNQMLTRFDKNIANNFLDFSSYESDGQLIKDLAIFFSHDLQFNLSQENLFGKKILDPAVFAKVVGRKNYKALFNRHPSPSQLKESRFSKLSSKQLEAHKKEANTVDGEPLFLSLLDNALYKCRYESLRFSKKGKTPNGFTTSELGEIRFLKSLKKFYHPIDRKIYYEYELDDTLVNDLARYFVKFDMDLYTKLKAAHQDFYMALLSIRENHNTQNMPQLRIEWNFDNLCLLARTNCARPKENKRLINAAVSAVNNSLGSQFVTIDWQVGDRSKHAYTPFLNFSYSDKELLEKQTESSKRYYTFTLINLRAKFRENFPMISDELQWRQTFVKWLRDPDWLFELKHAVVINTHVQCFGKMPQNKKTKEDDPYDAAVLNFIKETIPSMADSPFVTNYSLKSPV